MKKGLMIRWGFFLIGLMVLALGISLTIQAKELGIGPWDVFHYGLFVQFGLTIGLWSIIVGFILIALTSLFTRSLPRLGSFLNMLLLGIFIDFFNFLLVSPHTWIGKIMIFLVGILVLGYGIGLYVAADLGAGPRDSIMLVITEKTGWKVQWVRNGIEVFVLVLGWMLGGPVGIGTVVIALTLGIVVGVSLSQCKGLMEGMIDKVDNKKIECR